MKKLIFALLILTPSMAWGDTFGNESSSGSLPFATANMVIVSKHTLSVDGTVEKLTQNLIIANGTPHVKGVIFADNAGSPGQLLAVTPETDCGVNWEPRLIDMTFSTGVELSAGTYWIGSIIDSNGANTYWGAFLGSSTKTSTDNTYSSPADWNATATTEANYSLQAYATYTPTGGGTATFGDAQIIILE